MHINPNDQSHSGSSQKCGNPTHAVCLLRAYHSAKTNHFYTTSNAELQNASSNLGYTDEGVAGYIFSQQEPSSVPLYRLYNGGVFDHFYTTSESERDNAARSLGYEKEGISGYVYRTAECGGVPLYRLYSCGGRNHFYTVSAPERDNASQTLGYTQEGVVGYILPYWRRVWISLLSNCALNKFSQVLYRQPNLSVSPVCKIFIDSCVRNMTTLSEYAYLLISI